MRTRMIENPIPVKQRHPNATEQQSIHRYSRNSRPRHAGPLFSSYCPRGKAVAQIRRLAECRELFSCGQSSPALYLSKSCTMTPGIATDAPAPMWYSNMSAQIPQNVFTTNHTISRLSRIKPFPAFFSHLVQIKLMLRYKRKLLSFEIMYENLMESK